MRKNSRTLLITTTAGMGTCMLAGFRACALSEPM